MDQCVNCAIASSAFNKLRRLPVDGKNNETFSTIQQWLEPQSVSSNDYICEACWDLAQKSNEVDQGRLFGHHNVCLRCGRGVKSKSPHHLHTKTDRESNIYNVIKEWILPRTIQSSSQICHACWVAADRAAVRMKSAPLTSYQPNPQKQEIEPQMQYFPTTPPNQGISHNPQVSNIILPDYMRANETERMCFISGCQGKERHRVPLTTRITLLNEYKYYVPENNRLCRYHLEIDAWDLLDNLRTNYVQSFTAKHIQDMLSLKDVVNTALRFDDINNMKEHAVHACIKLDKE